MKKRLLQFYTLATITFILILNLQNFTKFVKAEGSEPIIVIENPISGLEQSGDIQISGYAISDNGINRIDIYVDGTKVGQANLGILRQDVYDKYPTISGSLNSGYNFILNSRGYTDANHDIKLELIDNNLNKYITNVSVNFRNQRTSIMGNSVYSKDQLIKYFQQNNNIKDFNYISNFVNILFEEASIEGVRADVAFVQMMKETNFLKFTGSVREWQNNFAGLGATGTVPTDPNLPYGEKFDSIQIGIRAVIQHLQCYATTLPLKLDKVDTRYGSWLRGKAPYVEWLGINENPYGTGWASDKNYGYDIVNRLNKLADITITPSIAKVTSFNVSNISYLNQSYSASASASSINGVLYRFFEIDKSTGNWKLMQDYSEKNSFTWTPTKVGQFMIAAQVKDKYSSYQVDETIAKDVTVQSDKAKVSMLNIQAEIWLNKSTEISATATSPNGVLYRFFEIDKSTGNWKLMQDYSEKNSFTWTPTKVGQFMIAVQVKDKYSGYQVDETIAKDVQVKSGIIVLDAGHGGYDPGATREPYYEKNLNMQIVQKLGNILTNLGYNILYTRQPSYDTFIDLDERTSYANSTNADLFLSIHHNASTSTIPDGFSAHYSSYRPEVETQDTYVVYGGVRYPFVKEVTSKVNGKLYSTIYFNDNGTIRTASIDDCTVYDPTPSEAAVKSGLLADKLVETVTSLGLDKDGADPSKDHNLFVTRKTTMPSVLLEVGYISNPTEINKISQPSFQELIAQKIAEAIKMLF